MRSSSCQFAVVGAGPYGLAVASHLRAAGLETLIFGKPMSFWESHMPKGMFLRSSVEGSCIADPEERLTHCKYVAQRGSKLDGPVPLEDFTSYGKWFQREVLPDADPRQIVGVERVEDGFRLELDDGEFLFAERVVIAAGIGAFPHYPSLYKSLPSELVSHTSERINNDLSRFAGQRVLIVGGGQTAVESAALLHEAGAEAEVVMRRPTVRWLKPPSLLAAILDSRLNPLRAVAKIGQPGISWLVEHPPLFTMMSRPLQDWMAARAIRPAAASWLRPRTQDVTFSTGRSVVAATPRGNKIRLKLDDGTEREADHALLGTGYRISLARYGFLSPEIVQGVQAVDGYPVLNAAFESSVPGLYFVGPTAAHSFGPVCRFVVGTQFTARRLTSMVAKKVTTRRAALAVSEWGSS